MQLQRHHNDRPLISIITIVLNGDKYLEQTIQSVIYQSYKKIEYIVIDGASTDNSLKIINNYKSKIDCCLSEKDDGIADAMNKGIKLASGDYVMFLHADDYLWDRQCIALTIPLLKESIDLLICDIIFGKNNNRIKPRGFTFWFRFRDGINHQGLLCRKALFEELGIFDINLKITMDYEWLLRAYYNRCSIQYAPIIMACMRDTGISSKTDWPALKQRLDEDKISQYRHCHSFFMRQFYNVFWLTYMPFKYIKSKLM